MIQQDYILLIANCKRYKHKSDLQKQTWLRTLPSNILYFHLIGEPELDGDFKFDNEANVLYVKTKDDYCSLPDKMISAYSAVHKTYNFKYILKTDDDQQLIIPSFFNVLTNDLNHSLANYGGFRVEIRQPEISNYYTVHRELPTNILLHPTVYCNGRFYLLSSKSVKNLLTKKDLIKNEFFEDYAIGYYLDDNLKQNAYHFDSLQFFKDDATV